MKQIAMLLLAAGGCNAEVLRAYSEFIRFDPFGNIVKADRGAEPRHILSPGFARNGFASLRIVITLAKPASFTLEVGQNPIDAVKVQLYKEVFEQHNGEWIPDRLLPVGMPYKGSIPEAGTGLSGQTTATFWLDMWVDAKAPVDRIKVEPQLNVYDDWYVWPMEVRIMDPVYPKFTPGGAGLPPATVRADAPAIAALREAFCGATASAGEPYLSARQLIRRNAMQHLALGRAWNEDAMRQGLLKASGAATVAAWCETKLAPTGGPEWYLRFRDAIFNANAAPRLHKPDSKQN
jgi:hypothetical protein